MYVCLLAAEVLEGPQEPTDGRREAFIALLSDDAVMERADADRQG